MPVQNINRQMQYGYSTSSTRRTVTARVRLVRRSRLSWRPLLHQQFDLVGRELTPFLWLQRVIPQGPDSRTPQLDHRVTNQVKHSPDLLILSFVKQNLKPGVGFRLAQFPDLCRGRARSVFQSDAAPQTFNRLLPWYALHFSFVDFFDLVACGGYEICELAVIGQQQ